MKWFGVLFALFVALEAKSNGWNDDIKWQTLDDAKAAAKENGKPIMLVIHKSWCGACKSLKPKFAADKEIEKLSDKFNMVNTIDDDEPKGDQYSPDGGYIPRILFMDTEGTVMTQHINKGGNDKYKYYYPATSGIVAAMKRVADDSGKDEL